MSQNEATAPDAKAPTGDVTTPAGEVETGHETDTEILGDLVLDLEAITGMLERTRVAVAKGKPDVRLYARAKPVSIHDALDELGDILTRRTLQVRAQRAERDGTTDEVLQAALDAAEAE